MNVLSDPTTTLTGMLPAVILFSAILTAPIAWFLLRLYHRAVMQSMLAHVGARTPSVPPRVAVRASSAIVPPLTIRTLDVRNPSATPSGRGTAYLAASRSLRRTALVHASGGLAYAVVFALAYMIVSGGGFPPVRFLWLFICYLWPTVLVVTLVGAVGRADRVAAAGCYIAVALAIASLGLARNPGLAARDLMSFWLYANAPATILLLAFLRRRVRAVGPLVLAFIVAGVTGAFVTISALGASDTVLRAVTRPLFAIGLGGTTVFVLFQLVGFVILAIVGWRLLGWIGRRYEQKRTSDQLLLVDAVWLLFAVVQSIPLTFEGWPWIFTGAVGFAAYVMVTRVTFSFSRDAAEAERSPTLLLLRVFSLGRRSEWLFDALSKLWLRGGSISLIAGPDLVSTTVEPHEFLGFVGGRLSRQFVRDEADLDQRLNRLDPLPDPDGRHRVNEFFCHADTWQSTMRVLADRSDAVLMDLRTFSPTNQGCLFELQQILESVPLPRIILLVDASTDHAFLERTLRSLWEDLSAGSVNAALPNPEIRLFRSASASAGELRQLVALLLAVVARISSRAAANGGVRLATASTFVRL
jgi:hypothetical protein